MCANMFAGKDCALLTDGRFSGGSHGFCIGHVAPEAQEGGPIALVGLPCPCRGCAADGGHACRHVRHMALHDWGGPYSMGLLILQRLAAQRHVPAAGAIPTLQLRQASFVRTLSLHNVHAMELRSPPDPAASERLGDLGLGAWGAQVQNGDTIRIDAESRRMDVLGLDEAEWERRRAAWQAPPLKATQGTLYKYIKAVSTASLGCVTDF